MNETEKSVQQTRKKLEGLKNFVKKTGDIMTKPFQSKGNTVNSSKEEITNKTEIWPKLENDGVFTEVPESDLQLLKNNLNQDFNFDSYSIRKENMEDGHTVYRFKNKEHMKVDGKEIDVVFYLVPVQDWKTGTKFLTPLSVNDKLYKPNEGRTKQSVSNPRYWEELLTKKEKTYQHYDASSIIIEDLVYAVPHYDWKIQKEITEDFIPKLDKLKTEKRLNEVINQLSTNFEGLDSLDPEKITVMDQFLNKDDSGHQFYFQKQNSHSYKDSFMRHINLQTHIKDNLKFWNVEIDENNNIKLPITFWSENNRQEVGAISFSLINWDNQEIQLKIEWTTMNVTVTKIDKNLTLKFKENDVNTYKTNCMNAFVEAYNSYSPQWNNNTGKKDAQYYAGEKIGTWSQPHHMYPWNVINEWFMFEKQEISEKWEKIGNSFIFENGAIKDIYGKDLSKTGVFINDKLWCVHYQVDDSNVTFKNQEYRDTVPEYRTLSFIIDGKDQTKTFQWEYQEDGGDKNFILKWKRGEKRGEISVNWTPQVDENNNFTKKPWYEVPADDNKIQFSEMNSDWTDEVYNSIKASFYAKLNKKFNTRIAQSSYNEQKIQELFDTEFEKIKNKIKDFSGVILDGKVYEAKFKGNVVELTEKVPDEIQKLIEKINAFCSKVNDFADKLKISYADGELGDKNNGYNGIGYTLSLEDLSWWLNEDDSFTLNCKLTNNADVESTVQFFYKKGKFTISDTTVENSWSEKYKNVIQFNNSYYYYSYDNQYNVTLKRPTKEELQKIKGE